MYQVVGTISIKSAPIISEIYQAILFVFQVGEKTWINVSLFSKSSISFDSYLWFPIWFWITPNIILTLLENTDFSGKNVILFCTSEHVWIVNAVKYLEPYNLNVLASYRFAQDTTKEMVKEWIESL